MTLLLILVLVIVLLGCCGGGWYGSRVGWWGGPNDRWRNGAPGVYSNTPSAGMVEGDPNGRPTGIPFSNGSATQPAPAGMVEPAPIQINQQPGTPYIWNPLYVIVAIVLIVFLISILIAFLGGYL